MNLTICAVDEAERYRGFARLPPWPTERHQFKKRDDLHNALAYSEKYVERQIEVGGDYLQHTADLLNFLREYQAFYERHGVSSDIIAFSEKDENVSNFKFIGFDVSDGESALVGGFQYGPNGKNRLKSKIRKESLARLTNLDFLRGKYERRLNEHGLFANGADAVELVNDLDSFSKGGEIRFRTGMRIYRTWMV